MSDNALRVLAIDDEPGVNSFFKKAVESLGHDVIATQDVGEFKRAIETWRPAVVIIDVNMPGCDGIELLRYLAGMKCTAQICVSSGLDDRTVEAVVRIGNERGLRMGGRLSKPIRLADLQRFFAEQVAATDAPLSAQLGQAIAGNQLFLEYQPKLDCKLNRITGVEALVRWRHPQHGPLEPDRFVGLAEENGLINGLTDWVVSSAAQQTAAWRRQGLPIEVAVNISAKNTLDDTLPDRLVRLCRNHAAEPGWMILELAETGAMQEVVQTMDVLTRLRVKGFKLSIDDFGTGYSSLVQLQRMPFSELKIDRSFVARMAQSRDCTVIVEIIIDLARKLGLRSVAAGVENKAILDQLIRLGCDAAQGFYLSPPVAADRVPELVRGNATGAAARPRAFG
jgi:EAL domain-containing protein (putative c-di-GMP-specific phosphodiesterase class I)/ActR/RegA family two-component response regulator